jgi:hypothetical protein
MRVMRATSAAIVIAVVASATASAASPSAAGSDRKSAAAKPSPSSDKTSARDRKPVRITPAFRLASEAPAPIDLRARDARPSSFGVSAQVADSVQTQVGGLFIPASPGVLGDAKLLDADRYYDGRGPVTWRSNAFVLGHTDAAVDQVRVSVGGVARSARISPLSLVRPDANPFEDEDVDVTLTRGWPAAVKFASGRYALDVTPHAGLGFGGEGGSAEAGATVRFGQNAEDKVVDSLGVRDGASAYGDRGRWYVFAAASGRAVGLNMLRGQDGDWSRGGFTSDVTSKLIGDAQAGVAWRKGPMQASVGYIHREIKAKDQIMGMGTQEDSVVALSFSLRPHW